jgi:hypothetical protein
MVALHVELCSVTNSFALFKVYLNVCLWIAANGNRCTVGSRTKCLRYLLKMFRAPAARSATALGRQHLGSSRTFGGIKASYIILTEEVQQAQAEGRGVVALESTIISHGMAASCS